MTSGSLTRLERFSEKDLTLSINLKLVISVFKKATVQMTTTRENLCTTESLHKETTQTSNSKKMIYYFKGKTLFT